MTGEGEAGAARVEELVGLLRERLQAREVVGGIRVVGGAAMALRFRDDPDVRVTTDIDAVFHPRPDVDIVIAEIAAERGLPPDWLNAAAGAWVARRPPHPQQPDFAVDIATVEELIAMKMAAAREQDLHDLVIIVRREGIRSPSELVEIAYEYYGEASLALSWPREEYLEIAADVVARARAQTPHP
ncbi:hypothetical protein [Leifsonia aquatica]|uniref:hypothetical protein n=1 Tax=Leifsonia aquatica TaxID=144185 RepID=UPI0028AE26B4|nr:hypothetical protein [Leifsonia aquatica]